MNSWSIHNHCFPITLLHSHFRYFQTYPYKKCILQANNYFKQTTVCEKAPGKEVLYASNTCTVHECESMQESVNTRYPPITCQCTPACVRTLTKMHAYLSKELRSHNLVHVASLIILMIMLLHQCTYKCTVNRPWYTCMHVAAGRALWNQGKYTTYQGSSCLASPWIWTPYAAALAVEPSKTAVIALTPVTFARWVML